MPTRTIRLTPTQVVWLRMCGQPRIAVWRILHDSMPKGTRAALTRLGLVECVNYEWRLTPAGRSVALRLATKET